MNSGPHRLSIIVAMARNRVIGRDGDLPWHLSADLKRFRKLTTGHAILMGRKTYDSIGRPLPERRSIVITRNAGYHPEGVKIASSVESALSLVRDDAEAFIIGGATIYEQALPLADRLYVTLVEAEVDGDTSFPEIDAAQWQLVSEEAHKADLKNDWPYRFLIYDRDTKHDG